jgi:ribose/xylose/arabinose/galactoside ABC-type transport system permease subunit
MSGVGLELEIIAAVVIGGGSLSGGRGTILGTLAGAAMTAVIKSGCTQLGLADALQRIIIGAIIIGAVSIDQYRQQRLDAS